MTPFDADKWLTDEIRHVSQAYDLSPCEAAQCIKDILTTGHYHACLTRTQQAAVARLLD